MTPRPPIVSAALVAAAVLLCPSPAGAEFVTLKYDHSAGNPTVSNSLQANAPTGPFYWIENNLPPNTNFPPPTSTFCLELAAGQILPAPGTSVVFAVDSLAAAPTIKSADKAAAITELYGRFYDPAWKSSAFGGSNAAVAFQIALWELVYDGRPAPGNTTDLSNGTFNLSGGSAPYTIAQNWLNILNGDTSAFHARFAGQELIALVAPAPGAKQQDNVQNQICLRPVGVPAPAGLALGGIGLVVLAARARRPRAAI